jgi:nitroreductase
MALVERAVTLAQKSPSVCNRQAWKVHVITAEDEKRKVLDLQNGSRGFGDQANKVLIVTVELGNFLTVGERNQGWVDGGMFAMSLVYALHSLGLGTCCLNWAVRHERDRQLKHEVDISNSESIIMMIAVGHLPDEFPVAQATRRNVKGMLIVR